MGIIDSQCHLDKLPSCKDMTLSDLQNLNTDIIIHLPYVIANYVFPTKWHFIGDRIQEDPRIKLTFGIRPHMIAKAPFLAAIIHFRRLGEMLGRYSEAVGTGEVGLDFTATCTCSSGHDIRKIQSKQNWGSVSIPPFYAPAGETLSMTSIIILEGQRRSLSRSFKN